MLYFHFSIFILISCIFNLFAESSNSEIPESKSPNILFIMADDFTYNEIGCYGGQNAKTPNIDKLADEGLVFNRAYVSMAMCTPARHELYTGYRKCL